MNDDVLAHFDADFRRADFVSIITPSAWRGMTQAHHLGSSESTYNAGGLTTVIRCVLRAITITRTPSRKILPKRPVVPVTTSSEHTTRTSAIEDHTQTRRVVQHRTAIGRAR
jgi:hypothetical protein